MCISTVKNCVKLLFNFRSAFVFLLGSDYPSSGSMSEMALKEDPLSRIQREIIEVNEREKEFKEGHFRENRLMSESSIELPKQNGNREKVPKTLGRAVSTSHLQSTSIPVTSSSTVRANTYTRRFTPQTGTKGIMQRFLASKGKMPSSPLPASITSTIAPPPVFTDATHARAPEVKPVRKGYVPVEEKIQKELREMKDREHELKKMRKRQSRFDIQLSDDDTSSESEDDDCPLPGKLIATKSISELYQAVNEDLRSPSPRNSSGQESIGSLKPAKSLAELCDLAPGEEFLAPSSTRLIAQWESIIQKKQEAGAA